MIRLIRSLLFAGLMAGAVGGVRADEEADLRAKLLKYNTITGTEALNGQFRDLIKNKADAKKVLAAAAKIAKEKNQPFNYNAALLMGRFAQSQKDYELAKMFFGICSDQATKVQSGTKLADTLENMISLYSASKEYAKAVEVCQEFLKLEADEDSPIERSKVLIVAQMAQILARSGKTKEALKIVDNILDNEEGNWFFMRVRGFVLREAEKYDDAVEAFNETIVRLEKNKQMPEMLRNNFVRDTKYILSSIYIDAKKPDKSIELLEALVKEDAENPTYANDLGFVLADNDKRLDEAEKLIRSALEKDKARRKKADDTDPTDNSSYLDSLAWVLFKQKKFAEAKKIMLEVVKDNEDGSNVEILDHLADIHSALGEKKEAIEVWERAMKEEPIGKRDKERKLKIEEKLKAAKK